MRFVRIGPAVEVRQLSKEMGLKSCLPSLRNAAQPQLLNPLSSLMVQNIHLDVIVCTSNHNFFITVGWVLGFGLQVGRFKPKWVG